MRNKVQIKLKHVSLLSIIILLSSLCTLSHSAYTKNCHYSCEYCGSPSYSHCIICQQPFTLNPIKNANNIKQYYNTLEQQPWGTCLGQLPQTNPLGIVMVLIAVISLIWARNRTLFYLLSSMQTLSLLSLIQIAFTNPLSYVLQSLEYFMFVTSLNRPNRVVKLQIFDDSRYRMYQFLNSYDFQVSFLPVFIFSLCCFVVAFLIPACRYCSRRSSSLWSICNCFNLQQVFTSIQITSVVTFFFLIQQSILVIFIGIFLDDNFTQNPGNIVLVAIYILLLTLMIINTCSKNIDIFPNKIGQQIQIIKKSLTPIFIVLPVKAIIAVTGFMVLVGVLGLIFAKLQSKTKKRTQFHQKLISRQSKYRVGQLLCILMVIVYFLVQKFVQSYIASYAAGIATVFVIIGYFCCFLIQVGIEIYSRYYIKQDNSLYTSGSFSLSSLRQSKMLSQTIQNFQTTQQGIMDMVFFGRNRELDKQPQKKRSNIQLTLDHLNESIQNNNEHSEHLQRFTPSVSPKNRQLQRQLKSKTARTPKNDRSSRFKLNKIFDPEEENQIQSVDVPKASMKREEQKIEKENQRNNQQDENISVIVNAENITERTQVINVIPLISRRDQPIKTVREIRIEIGDGDDGGDQINDGKSPRFAVEKQIGQK